MRWATHEKNRHRIKGITCSKFPASACSCETRIIIEHERSKLELQNLFIQRLNCPFDSLGACKNRNGNKESHKTKEDTLYFGLDRRKQTEGLFLVWTHPSKKNRHASHAVNASHTGLRTHQKSVPRFKNKDRNEKALVKKKHSSFPFCNREVTSYWATATTEGPAKRSGWKRVHPFESAKF